MNGLAKPRAFAASLSSLGSLGRAAFASLLAVASLLLATSASAGGSFRLRSTSVPEVSGGWHIYCDLSMSRPPDIAHQTLKFLFTKTAVFERDLVDNNPNPVTNRQALVGQNPSVESLEVDFSDASGKIYKGTHFDFSVTRLRGYEAGEYQLKVRTSDGVDIGSPARLVLNGDNPVVDRRAMTFDAKKSGMKKVNSGFDGGTAPHVDESSAAVPNNGAVVASGDAPPFLSADAFKEQPEEMHQRPKGCGCDVPGLDAGGLSEGARALLMLATGLGLSAIGWRKRRTRSS
jgi:hypothetical protein